MAAYTCRTQYSLPELVKMAPVNTFSVDFAKGTGSDRLTMHSSRNPSFNESFHSTEISPHSQFRVQPPTSISSPRHGSVRDSIRRACGSPVDSNPEEPAEPARSQEGLLSDRQPRQLRAADPASRPTTKLRSSRRAMADSCKCARRENASSTRSSLASGSSSPWRRT
jgi:hypothetical protein